MRRRPGSPTLVHSGRERRGSCPVKGELLELLGRDIAQGAVQLLEVRFNHPRDGGEDAELSHA